MTLKTERWDVSKHLDTDEKIALFLEAVFEDGDSATIAAAIGEVARVKGMGQVARDSGLSRENLHRALRSDGNPEFDMVVRVMKAMGFDLRHAACQPSARDHCRQMTASPRLASSAILERDGRWLLVLRRNPPSEDMYAFPGGRAEAGETPAETALREFAEETGILARNPRAFATYDLVHQAKDGSIASHFFLSVFLVDADVDAIAVAADDAAAIGWFTLEEIRGLLVPPSVLECVERLSSQQ